jgi:hypothetical protein
MSFHFTLKNAESSLPSSARNADSRSQLNQDTPVFFGRFLRLGLLPEVVQKNMGASILANSGGALCPTWKRAGQLALLRVLHGATESLGFLMLKAYKSYMDETGIQRGDRYCSIAGYIMTASEWDDFGRDWRFVLGEYMRDVPEEKRYFHALEFYGGDKKYKNWTSGKRNSFIKALFGVIHDLNPALFASSVDSECFFSLTEDERRYLTGGIHNGMKWKKHGAPTKPYYLPFTHCIVQSTDLVPDDAMIFPVMSRQDQYEMHALEIYEGMLSSDPPMKCREKLADDMIFSDPKMVPGLQAADLAAYWFGKSMTYVVKTGDRLHKHYPNMVEMTMLLHNVRDSDDLKLFNFQGLMLVMFGANRYIKTSFPTLDQLLPSLPVEERKKILSVMRKADLRKFLDQWKPTPQANHGQSETALDGHSEPTLLRWIRRLSPLEFSLRAGINIADQ